MTTPSQDPTGARIGSYRVLRKLGAGGMGEVFLAEDDRLDRQVAIKRIVAHSGDRADLRERLRREARAAASLSHPSVVRVYDIVEERDGDAIVMEYLEGRTLRDILLAGELEGEAAIEILLQIADGLEAAHRHGLVHRDLKGENVIVSPTGDAKILDFGLAKASEPDADQASLTKPGMPLGTLRSMSPEQCEGENVDARSDLFSLGVLMFEMFGGRTPFGGKTLVQTLASILSSTPPNLRELNGSVPDELSELIAALLEKDPEDRPPSAEAVAARLEEVQRSASLSGLVVPMLIPPEGLGETVSSHRESSGTARRRRRTVGATSTSRRLRAPRPTTAAILVIGTLAIASFAALQFLGNDQDLSANRVMVFPLPVSGGANLAASAGEDVATMIGTALEGTAPLYWIDAWPLLDAESRADIRSLEIDDAAALARARGCGRFIWGRVVATGDSATVVLNLYDAGGDPVATSEATGPSAIPWRAGLRAVNGLLSELIPTAVPDIEATIAARPPAAVAQYLLGESAFRRASVEQARGHFETAFSLDSTFALAGLRGAQTAAWAHDHAAARTMLQSVLALPLRSRWESFAQGVLAYVDFDGDAAVSHLSSALAEDSTMAPAWAALGEVYRHRAPREPWLGDERPFSRALEQDSLAANVLFHRLEEVMGDGDLPTARVLRQRFLAAEPDPGLLRQVHMMYRCLEDGPTVSDWQADTESRPHNVEFAAGQFLVGARNLPCAESLMRGLLQFDSTTADNPEGRYWSGFLGLTSSKLAQGDFDDVRRLIDAAAAGFESFQSLVDRSTVDSTGVVFPEGDAPWVPRDTPLRSVHEQSLTRWSELAILVGTLYPQLADLAAKGARDLRGLAGADYTGTPYRTSIWMLGLWEGTQNNPEETARAADRIRSIAGGQENELLQAYTLRMAETLDIHRLLAEGNEGEALQRLRNLTANADEGTIFVELVGSFPLERLIHAQLEERLGDPERALHLVLGFDEPSALVHLVPLPQALALCVRTAGRLGDVSRMRSCEERLRGLGWTPEDFAA